MSIYKKAVEAKLRFQSRNGLLSVEQLFELKLKDLEFMLVELNDKIKSVPSKDENLSFLRSNTDADPMDVLRFDILKDVYTTLTERIDNEKREAEKRVALREIDALIAKKEQATRENLSLDELIKLRESIAQ